MYVYLFIYIHVYNKYIIIYVVQCNSVSNQYKEL